MKNTENNILIAEFMGYKNIRKPNEYPIYEIPEHSYEVNDYGQITTIDTFSPQFDDMRFNTSWDWLMPVVEKIENHDSATHYVIHSTYFNNREVSIKSEISRNFFNKTIIYEGNQTKLSATYEIVVEFIKWYNQQK